MENNKRIQYAVAFSVIAILVFQSFSMMQLQSAYALTYSTINTTSSGEGKVNNVITAVRSGDTIFYYGRPSSSLTINNVTAIDANTHNVLMSSGTCGEITACSVVGYSQLIPCETCSTTVDGDSVYLYSAGFKKFNGTGLIANTIPCTDAGNYLTFHNLHQKKYLSIYDISSYCGGDKKIWNIDGNTLATTELTPTLTNLGGINMCPTIADGFIDNSNKRVVALCYASGVSTAKVNLYSYTTSSLSDLTLTQSFSIDNNYRHLSTSGNSYSFITVTSGIGSHNLPPLQLSLTDSGISIFHTFPLSGNLHIPMFIPNPNAPSAIGVLWIYDLQNRVINGFLPHNSTALGGRLCAEVDCAMSNSQTLPMSYDFDDRNFFYTGGYTTKKILIWNSTDDTEAIYEIDTTAGNGTNGNGNSTGGTTGNTCDFSDPACTIPKQIGHGLCVFHLFDCDTNDDIKTNGVGFLLLIVMLGLLIVFFAILRKKANLQIHPIIWVGGMLAVFGLAVGAQLIEGYWFILAIVVIVAFGGFNFWNGRRGES